MEVIDIEKLLKKNGIQEKVIFYGIEDIATNNPIWRIFSDDQEADPQLRPVQQAAGQQAAGGRHPGGM